ncbi:MAG: formylglycine-generating enzyme family protein [Thermomicrobiales bacterium]
MASLHGEAARIPETPPRPGMVWIPGGVFAMGDTRFYPEERPVRVVEVAGFWIDRRPVTNQQFSRFVAATGYQTIAEQLPDPALYPGAPPEHLVAGSMVFTPTNGPAPLEHATAWWRWTPGASWRRPRGPGSSATTLGDHPVTQVALADVEAYCAWAGAALPTEAEWEYAARGGLEGAIFAWGDEERPNGQLMANTWQGHFPWQNTREDGHLFTAPVGSYPGNGYGLLDMIGNVWEWTADWYVVQPDIPAGGCCAPAPILLATPEASISAAQTAFRIPRRVVKGGSHLCAPNYCFRYRPAARQPMDIDTGMSHLGFRCVIRPRRV